MFVLVLATPWSARALNLIDSNRQVVVNAFSDVSGIATRTASTGFDSFTPGTFLEAAVDGTTFGDFSITNAEAVQDSSITRSGRRGLRVEGGGSSGVSFDVQDPGQPSRARATATSLLSILFEVEVDSPFVLALSVQSDLADLNLFSATASVLDEVVTTASLVGATSGVV